MSYGMRFLLAVLALIAAVFLALLALDVNGVAAKFADDDVRFQRNPGDSALWLTEEETRLPGNLAERMLRVDDDRQFRSAVRFFRLSGLRSQSRSIEQSTFQQAAELELSRVGRRDSDPKHRSAAANLRGVINLVEAATSDQPGQLLQLSLTEFRDAIRLDGENDDAKYNLELVLQIASDNPPSSDEQGGGARGDTPASGAGAATSGSGY